MGVFMFINRDFHKPLSFDYPEHPKFGAYYSPLLFKMKVKKGQVDDFRAEIVDFKSQSFHPGLCALHYGQSVFEGMKAYRQKDGGAGIFRLDLHAERFLKSAKKMVMAEVPQEIFKQALTEYVRELKDLVPSEEGHSLYLRPLLFNADEVIKVGPGQEYWFYIMSTAAGSYFTSGGESKKAKVYVNPKFIRAFPGGNGEAKTAGNYAASLGPQSVASSYGCDQVLFLNALDHESIDEMGGMNVFFIEGDQLITPELNGCILNGVTRRSIISLASEVGLKPLERKIGFSEVSEKIKSGAISEAFACGTAAVIAPIGEFLFQKHDSQAPEEIALKQDSVKTMELLTLLNGVHRGQFDKYNDWIFKV